MNSMKLTGLCQAEINKWLSLELKTPAAREVGGELNELGFDRNQKHRCCGWSNIRNSRSCNQLAIGFCAGGENVTF